MNTTIFTKRLTPLVLVLVIFSMTLSACASRGGRTYSDGEVRQAQSVQYGVVANVENVRVEEDPKGLGTVLGGVAGGILGSMVGGGRGRTLAILGGAAAGAVGGTAAESALSGYEALQITVDLENGSTVVIVQGTDDYFSTGDRVRVISSAAGRARVQHR